MKEDQEFPQAGAFPNLKGRALSCVCLSLLCAAQPARAAGEAGRGQSGGRAAIYVLAGGALLGYDHWIEAQTNHTHSPKMTSFSRHVGRAGNSAYLGGFLAVWLGAGALLGNKEMTGTALLAGKSLVIASAVGATAKVALGRYRPYTHEPFSFRPFSFDAERQSFPSGHTVAAFSVASVFAARADGVVVPAAAYGLASVVAAQRIYSRRHWVSDVAAGAFIGTYVGRRVVKAAAAKKSRAVLLIPELDPARGYAGLRARCVF